MTGGFSGKAGVPIYHEPWMPHAIQTNAVPLLAIYIWQGDNLTQKSMIDLGCLLAKGDTYPLKGDSDDSRIAENPRYVHGDP